MLADPAVARKRTRRSRPAVPVVLRRRVARRCPAGFGGDGRLAALVQSSRQEFDDATGREFLNGEGFRRFDEARDRLLDLLEFPGAGRAFAMVMFVSTTSLPRVCGRWSRRRSPGRRR